MRRLFFWTHFSIGLVAALFIFVMSVTGVLLAFEKQITTWARNAAIEAPEGATPMDADALIALAQANGAGPGARLVLPSDPGDAVELAKSRRDVTWLNPYDGSVVQDPAITAVFHRIEVVHRWFAVTGGRTEVGALLMDGANAIFALILVSGVVLWWPKRWSWPQVRQRIFFRKAVPTAQARNFNWHHVFGFWALLPLAAIVLSAVMMSYGAISGPIYAVLGASEATSKTLPEAGGEALPLGTLVADTVADAGRWKTVTVTLPEETDDRVNMVIDRGNGIAPAAQQVLSVARDGSGAEVVDASSNPRFVVRFLHTGELYGLIGQAVAALASLAAAFLVYTGVTLGIGRLRRMLRPARRPARG
ncbi:MAG: hypothetical protein CML66_18095 [Rhodobacteraceae bacterium]|nr:hypothetical protein [Paracoccaceae bacterium]